MTVQISVIDDSHKYRWYHWRRKHHQKILKFLQDTVEPEIKNISQGDDVSGNYPWCFVFSEQKPNSNRYYIGALAVSNNSCNKNSLCVIFCRLPYVKFSEDFKKKFHVAFWQARILATQQDKINIFNENSHFSEWIKSLQIHYSPFWESVLIRKNHKFINASEILLSNCHMFDNQTSIDSGVEFMPWKNWPECVQSGDFVWLWRQSRYGRVIDSRKIPIPMDITNVRR